MLNKVKYLFFVLILIFFVNNTFSYINVSSCGTNLNVPDTEYRLNQSISTTGTCLTISNMSIILDCQGFNITGDDTGVDYGVGVTTFWAQNTTIKNCFIQNFGSSGDGAGIKFLSVSGLVDNVTLYSNYYGIYSQQSSVFFEDINSSFNSLSGLYLYTNQNYHLFNVVANNNNNGIYIRYNYANEGNFSNVLVSGNTYGVYFQGKNSNMIFSNITSVNNQNGFYLYSEVGGNSVYNNTILNSNISSNSNSNIYFSSVSSGLNQNNTFLNNYLGNWSKINSSNWNASTPNYFYDNVYDFGTVLYSCFDYNSLNLSCESSLVVLPQSGSNLNSIFPLNSNSSSLIVFFLILSYFIF